MLRGGQGSEIPSLEELVLGATGRYSSLVRTLLAAGHRVRAGTRRPKAATQLLRSGAQIAPVDLDDVSSIAGATAGVDAMFAAGTFHRSGPEGDVAQGRNVIDAARIAGVPHLVCVSVAGADRRSDVPLFESKHRARGASPRAVFRSIVAPMYFMENLWNPWNVTVLTRGPSRVRSGPSEASSRYRSKMWSNSLRSSSGPGTGCLARRSRLHPMS